MPPPSFRALRAFVEVTRAGSVAAAAGQLGVTPSAVSHLLRDLETSLGFALFAGRGPGAPLTEPAMRLAARLGGAFAAIDLAVAEAQHRSGDVRVSALSSFSTLWLVPRLARFQAAHPEVRLLLATGTRPVDLASEPFECAIRWGRGNWPGLQVTLLFREEPVAVANPRLLAEHGGLKGMPRLAARSRPEDWSFVTGDTNGNTPVLTFETRGLAVQAAVAGIGAAVVDRALVADLLDAGLLVQVAPDRPVARPEGHFFVARAEALRDRHVRAFRDWLLAEAAAPLALGRRGGPARVDSLASGAGNRRQTSQGTP